MHLLVISTRIKNVFEKKDHIRFTWILWEKGFLFERVWYKNTAWFSQRFILRTPVQKMDVFGCKRKLQSWNDPINSVFQF